MNFNALICVSAEDSQTLRVMIRLTLHISEPLPSFPLYLFTFFLPAFPLVLGLNERSSLVFRRGGTRVVTAAIFVPWCVTQTCKLKQGGPLPAHQNSNDAKISLHPTLESSSPENCPLPLYSLFSLPLLFSMLACSLEVSSLNLHEVESHGTFSAGRLGSMINSSPAIFHCAKTQSKEATCMWFWSTSLG